MWFVRNLFLYINYLFSTYKPRTPYNIFFSRSIREKSAKISNAAPPPTHPVPLARSLLWPKLYAFYLFSTGIPHRLYLPYLPSAQFVFFFSLFIVQSSYKFCITTMENPLFSTLRASLRLCTSIFLVFSLCSFTTLASQFIFLDSLFFGHQQIPPRFCCPKQLGFYSSEFWW